MQRLLPFVVAVIAGVLVLSSCGQRQLTERQFVDAGNGTCEHLRRLITELDKGDPVQYYADSADIHEMGEDYLRALKAPRQYRDQLFNLATLYGQAKEAMQRASDAARDKMKAALRKAEADIREAGRAATGLALSMGLYQCGRPPEDAD